jgi:hypothetical protein
MCTQAVRQRMANAATREQQEGAQTTAADVQIAAALLRHVLHPLTASHAALLAARPHTPPATNIMTCDQLVEHVARISEAAYGTKTDTCVIACSSKNALMVMHAMST